ncbi:MAG: DUF167 domain-containing protein [Candidatus Thorarchaeota archaeon]
MTENLLWENERGTFLRVLVRPNSGSVDLIENISETELLINLKGPAREGKANKELVKRIAKVLGISSGNITLVAGQKTREKTLLITSLSAKEVWDKLSALQKR